MNFFESTDYRKLLLFRVYQYPKKGYGILKKISEHLNVNSTFISQVVSGTKDFNLEQASLLCEFFGYSELETKYFLLLVQKTRAGNESLRKFLKKQIEEVRVESNKLSARLTADTALSDSNKAIFYSKWYYSAVRQMLAIPGHHNPESIAVSLGLPRKVVVQALEFLLKTGLCREENSKIVIGPSSTHLGAESPLVKMHHLNWRNKAMDLIDQDHPSKLHYSSPMTLSKKDVQKVRALLLDSIEQVGKTVDNSESEEFYCLNLDWFKVSKE